MCDSCVAEAEYYGEFLPGWHLERATKDGEHFKANTWGLVWCNAPSFVFPTKPEPEPVDPDQEAEDMTWVATVWNPWLDRAMHLEDHAESARTTYYLVKAAVDTGKYNPEEDADFEVWLYDFLGKYLIEHPSPIPYDESPLPVTEEEMRLASSLNPG